MNERALKVAIVTGTHHQPFDRLVQLGGLLAQEDDVGQVWIQAGSSTVRPAGCEVVGVVSPQVLQQVLTRSDVVLCHAGPGSVRAAWAAGHHPMVVPRDPGFGEHVDDHQLRTGRRMADPNQGERQWWVVTDTADVRTSWAAWRAWSLGRAVPRAQDRTRARQDLAQHILRLGRTKR